MMESGMFSGGNSGGGLSSHDSAIRSPDLTGCDNFTALPLTVAARFRDLICERVKRPRTDAV
jgi:hypothetical protein